MKTRDFYTVGWLLIFVFLFNPAGVFAASKVLTSQADFAAGNTSQLIDADVDGNPKDYLRLINTNPGMDGTPGDKLAPGSGRVFAFKRHIPLTETRGRDRFLEKIQLNIEQISGAKENWGDLRLVNSAGNSVPFRILNFETPVDNPNSYVTLLFEAYASQSAVTDYWLYYGNPNATSVAVDNISPFYLLNHDFEDGSNNWAVCSASTLNSNVVVLGLLDGVSILPSGYVGYESKGCLQAYYPEGGDNGNENGKWRGWSQTVTGPTADLYIATAYKKSYSGAYDKRLNTYLRHIQSGADSTTNIPAGVTDWTTQSLEFNTGGTRTFELAAGMYFGTSVNTGWRERGTYIDWIDVQPKYPLNKVLGIKESAGYNAVGSFTSAAIDTGITSPQFGKITWIANTNSPGTSVYFQTRSGGSLAALNTAPWSADINVNGADIPSANARYLQVRAFLETTDTAYTPVLDEIEVFFDLPATKLQVLTPANVTAGDYFDFRVTALDNFNATATTFVGNVTMYSVPAGVTFLPNVSYVFQPEDQGTALFQARKTNVGNFEIFATSVGLTDGASGNIVCGPGPVSQLVMVAPPGTVTAGNHFNISIEARDRYGNVDTNANLTLTSYCADPYPASITPAIQLTGGYATLPNTVLFTKPSQTIVLQAPSNGMEVQTSINVNAAATNKLRLAADPDQYQNVPFDLTVDAVDVYGNVTGYGAAYNLSLSAGAIAPNTGTLVSGTKTQSETIDTEGNITISAVSGAFNGNMGVIVHPQTPAALDTFRVDAGSIQLAGVPFTLTIEALDEFLNLLPSYKGACRLTVNVGSITPEFTAGYSFLDGIMAIPVKVSGASDTVVITVYDLKDNTKLGMTYITVQSSTLDHFDVTAPAALKAGASCTFEVRPRDSSGNLLTKYTGTISISNTSTGGDVFCPSIYTFQPSDNGVKTFTATEAARFTKAEVVRLRVEDAGRRGLSEFIEIMAASDSPKIEIRPDKFTIELGESLSYNAILTDPYQNPLEGFTGTLNLNYTDPAVTGPANYTYLDFEDGSHRFLNQVRSTQLGSFTIEATEPVSGATATSPLINVISGETGNFSIIPSSISISAGDTFLFNITASDTSGNLNVLYNGSVRFSTLDTQAVLPADSTLINGAGAFNATFKTEGVFELSARDTRDPGIVGTMAVTVIASVPSKLELEIQDLDLNVNAGIPFPYRLHVKDAFGNHASYTGNIEVSAADKHASADHTKVFALANESVKSDNWTLITAGVQDLLATGAAFVDTRSERVVVNAGSPDHIAGDFPNSVYSEFYYPFKVRIEDIYGNPSPLYTNTITPVSSGPSFAREPNNHAFSSGDNGEYVFNLQWDRGTGNPITTNLTFQDSGALANLTFPVLVDCPRSNNPVGVLANFWLSRPDRRVIASEPFGMTIRASTGRDRLATVSVTVEFDISQGDFWVNDGGGWQKTITMTNESQKSFQAMVTRTGYLAVIAKSQAEPLKTGTVSFVAKPNKMDSLTITADTPQMAGKKFPFVAEWWDVCKNYAETATETITLSATSVGANTLEPSDLIPTGWSGKFDASITSGRWTDKKFWASNAETNINHDKLLNEISILGLYDEDFTDGALDNPNWQVMIQQGDNVSEACVGSHSLNGGCLYIETSGDGNLFDDTSQGDYQENEIDDGYYFLYQPWPATDTFDFDARVYVLRYWYDTRKRTNQSMVGIMIRDNSHTMEPRYICAQLQNTTNSGDFNMNTTSQVTYRNTPDGYVYRGKNNTSNGNSGTHPKWLRIRRLTATSFEGAQSNDEVVWDNFTSRMPTAVNISLGNPQMLGIAVCADSTTYPGIGWFTKFKVNRYYQQGVFESAIHDVGTSTVTFNQISLLATKPGGTQVIVEVRASNNSGAMGAWTNLGNITNASIDLAALNNRRYFQYRLTLNPNTVAAGVYDATPVVRQVDITYDINPIGHIFEGRETVTLNASTTFPAIDVGTCSVEIKGGDVASLSITVPASCIAGEPFTISVSALDAFGNIADDASGSWSFTTSDGSPYPGVVPPAYILVPVADKGQHTFHKSSILYNGPTATISVTDGNITATSAPIVVNPGLLKEFGVHADSPQVASTSFEVGVTAYDLYDNVKSDYTGTVTFYDDKTGGNSRYVPSSIAPGDWVGGVATLSPGVSFTKVETVHVSAQGDYRSGTSNPIEINSATSSALMLTVSTTQPEAGVPFSLNVMAVDNFGNQANTYNGTVKFSVTDTHGSVVIPADYNFVPADNGLHLWVNAATLITPGLQTIRVEDSVDPTMFSEVPVVVLPGPIANFKLECSATQTANVPFNLLITAYDAYGNPKTNFSEAVTLSSTFDSILPVTAGGFSNGQLLIPSTEIDHSVLPTTGQIDVNYGSAIGTLSVTMMPSAAIYDHIFMEAIPDNPSAGDAFKLTIKTVGADGAVFTGYSGIGVDLTASNTLGFEVVPPMSPDEALTFDLGVKEVYARIWEAGTITIWAHDKTLGKVGSLTIEVLPTNLSYFTVVPGTSSVNLYPNNYYQEVGASFPLYLGAYDSIDNLKSDYSGNVTLTHNGTGTYSVASVTFENGVATVPAAFYDDFGRMRITAYDSLLDRKGISNYIYFFGPLAEFDLNYGLHQSDETPFLLTVEGYDTYGQLKLNCMDTTSISNISYTPGSISPVTMSPMAPALVWKDGVAYEWITPDRKNGGVNEATASFRLDSNETVGASGTATFYLRKKGGGADHFLIETYSPQIAGEPFPMLVKAVNSSNQIDTSWSGTVQLFATDTVTGLGYPLVPSSVTINPADNGVYSNPAMVINNAATYTLSANYAAMNGTFTPFLVKQRPVSKLVLNVPQYAPLNQNFQMTISAYTDNGNLKTDYVPEGPILLKLNATATGILGIQFVDPSEFVGGIATITTQNYNKSQKIFIYANEPYLNKEFIGGPIDVFGIPTKLILQPLDGSSPPMVDPSRDFFWMQFFQVRATVKDSNGFTVANFDQDIHFKMKPGLAPPTAVDANIVGGYDVQHFFSSSNGVQDFIFKVDYSTMVTPINLRMIGSFTYGMSDVTKEIGDLPFHKIIVFDHYEITTPDETSGVVKGATFTFSINAVDNFNNPIVLASAPNFTWAHTYPATSPTNLFVWPPAGGIAFPNVSTVNVSAFIDYDDDSITSFTFTITPEDGTVGSDSVNFPVKLGDPRVSTELFDIEPSQRYVLSMYIKTLDGITTGTAIVEAALYQAGATKVTDAYKKLADLTPQNSPASGTATAGYSNGWHGWKRYYWYFDTDVDTPLISIRLGSNAGEVLVDGIQLEKAADPAEPFPSKYSPHPLNIIHPSVDGRTGVTGKEYWKK